MLSEIIPIISIAVTCFVAIFALRTFQKRPVWIDETIDELMEGFLKPDEEGKNVVDHLAERFGKGFRMSLLAQKSGEARHQKMLENRVIGAVMDKSPELKLAMSALEQFGLEDIATPENMPALLNIARKYGLFEYAQGLTPVNPQKTSSNGSWRP